MLKINNILRIASVLNYRQKQKGVLLLFVILVATILETVGMGLIIPFLAVIVDPNVTEKYSEFTGIVIDSSNVPCKVFLLYKNLIGAEFFTKDFYRFRFDIPSSSIFWSCAHSLN